VTENRTPDCLVIDTYGTPGPDTKISATDHGGTSTAQDSIPSHAGITQQAQRVPERQLRLHLKYCSSGEFKFLKRTEQLELFQLRRLLSGHRLSSTSTKPNLRLT